MSYTLRGRLDSRLAGTLLPFAVACALALALEEWWPVQLAALMLAVGVALDVTAYHRLLPYQPGWAAVPLGLLELALVMGLARALELSAPLVAALAFFAAAWLQAQVLTHAGFPLLHLSYAEEGGELGRGGTLLDASAPATLLLVVGIAWVTQPPTVRLESGVHQGPLLLDHAQRLVGEPGAVVRGGIRITADDVVVRDVAVFGGEYGIQVENADRVVLDGVSVAGAVLDGINVRRSSVTIRDCAVTSLQSPFAQGIDISFGFDLAPSTVEGCSVSGAREGIVSHFANVMIEDNRVSDTGLRAITVTEMSMGEIEGNRVDSASGVGIFCGDYSQCRIAGNSVANTRPDPESDEGTRQGYAIQAHYGATATLDGNTVVASPYAVGSFFGARIERE